MCEDEPQVVVLILDCTDHMVGRVKKDTELKDLKKRVEEFDAIKQHINCMIFNDDANVQKAGAIIGAHFVRAKCFQREEHRSTTSRPSQSLGISSASE